MIPILYRADEYRFLSNGLGRLYEVSECTVTEERNGIYELEFKYPITGRFYQYMIEEGGVVAVIHDDQKDIQPFDIYRYSAPIDGIVTFNAHHISYRLANIIVKPFEAASAADAFQGLYNNAINKCNFTFWTDKNVSANFSLTHPDNIRALLGGQQGSILDVYGKGDYEFDKYDVKLYVNRGADRGVTIRYGKNLADIQRVRDDSGVFSAIAPYWTNGEETIVLPEGIVLGDTVPTKKMPWTDESGNFITDGNGQVIYFQYLNIIPVQMDFSSVFTSEEAPTVEELRQAAIDYLNNNDTYLPADNVTIDFVQLWQTPEYENVASLQRVSLCDTVSIYYPELGVTQAEAKVIKVVYNVLLERYDSMEVGAPKTTLAQSVANTLTDEVAAQIAPNYPSVGFMERAINEATDKISGGLGGHVVMTLNADGQPQEILIMDNDDIQTAVHVIRMNQAGIGFSNSGYEGPFASAWTIDGKFNADFIATGTLLANYIRGGTLTLGGIDNASGVIRMYDRANNEIGSWTNTGIVADSFRANFKGESDGYVEVDDHGFRLISTDDDTTIATASYGYYSGTSELIWSTWGFSFNCAKEGVRRYAFIGPSRLRIEEGTVSGGYVTLDRYINADLYGSNVIELINDSVKLGNGNGFISVNGDCQVDGTFSATGTKARIADADQYGKRTLYCYETPSPLFGDVGEGVIDETGLCYVWLDPVFAETIATNQYQVFLQRYGQGDCFVAERKPDYFVVSGEPGLSFGWELKAKQRDFDQIRLERSVDEDREQKIDYGKEGINYYIGLQEGRIEE